MFSQRFLVQLRFLESQIERSRRQLPDFSSQKIWQTDSYQAMEIRLPYKSSIPSVLLHILVPKPHLAPIAQLLRIAGILEHTSQSRIRRTPRRAIRLLGRGCRIEVVVEEVLGIALLRNGPHVVHFLYPLPQAPLQPITEPLTLLPATLQLNRQLWW